MGYRDESESLRARALQLEGELAEASATIARLEGATPRSGARRELRESRLLGAPAGVMLEHTLPFTIDERGYEAIAEIVRTRLVLQVSQVGHSLTTLGDRFSLQREGGSTMVRLRGDWSLLKGSIVVVPAITGILGGLPIFAVLHDISTHGSPSALLHAAWMLPTLLGGAAWLGRRGAKQLAEQNLRNHQGVLEAVLRVAEKHAVRAPGVHARVDVSDAEVELAEPGDRSARSGAR